MQVAHLAHWVGRVRGTCVVCVRVCAWHAHAWACGCMQVRGVQSMLRGACTAWSMVQVAHLAHGAWHVSGTCTACAWQLAGAGRVQAHALGEHGVLQVHGRCSHPHEHDWPLQGGGHRHGGRERAQPVAQPVLRVDDHVLPAAPPEKL